MNVKTADRTLLIFEAFADRCAPMTLSELARLLDMPVSTCFNLMRTLQARGYLYEVAGRKMFYPTARWLVKAQAIASHDPVLEQVAPFLDSLCDQTGESVILGKRQGQQVVYLTIVEPDQSIRYTATAGDLRPLYSTSAGKALLGAMPAKERGELIAGLSLDRVTDATITQRPRLLQDIEEGLRRGWFLVRGENVADVMGIAVSLPIGGDSFTITVAGPIHRMDPKVDSHARELLATCEAIVRGGSVPRGRRARPSAG